MSNNCDSLFNALFNNRTNFLKKIALIIVDFQNDFISGSLSTINSPSKQNSAEIVLKLNSILEYFHYFEKVFISKDWHPKDHISFHSSRHCYVKYAGKNFNEEKIKNANVFDVIAYTLPCGITFDQQLWPDHCVQNTFGSEIHKDLAVKPLIIYL
ncbi:hypothetical protein MXB_1868 [Myxobolus squamalis]|nr:hypothetical protein MXB_1868 [Myxobolus squamalis]